MSNSYIQRECFFSILYYVRLSEKFPKKKKQYRCNKKINVLSILNL